MSSRNIIILGILFLLLIIGIFFFTNTRRAPVDSPIVTNFEECKNAGYPVMESYPEQCRDVQGNLFIRVIADTNPTPGPNPSERVASGYIAGNVDIGPFCPVERADEPCQTPPEAYSSREVVIYLSDKVTVKEKGILDSQGNYKIAIGPGNYFVQIVPAGIGEGEKKPVTVKSFETTTVNFDIDTGIR